MRIATWNVNSVRARLPRLIPWLRESAPDVLCLQELKCVDESLPRAELEAEGYQVEAYGQKTYNGVAILSKTPLADVLRGMPGEAVDADRRVITATVGGTRVVNVYVVNGKEVASDKYEYKLRWMEGLRAFVEEQLARHPKLVLTGDFNVTFDDRDVYDPEAWREKIHCSTPERRALGALVDLGLSDAFRRFHEDAGHYTWWDFRTRGFQRKQGLRIDHLLLSEPALRACRSVEIDVAARDGEKPSDHAPVVAEMDL